MTMADYRDLIRKLRDAHSEIESSAYWSMIFGERFEAAAAIESLLTRVTELEARLGREMDTATMYARLCVCKDNDTDAAKKRADELLVQNDQLLGEVFKWKVIASEEHAAREEWSTLANALSVENDKLLALHLADQAEISNIYKALRAVTPNAEEVQRTWERLKAGSGLGKPDWKAPPGEFLRPDPPAAAAVSSGSWDFPDAPWEKDCDCPLCRPITVVANPEASEKPLPTTDENC